MSDGVRINFRYAEAGGRVSVSERFWPVTSVRYELGHFTDKTCRLEPIEDPFGPRLSPMSPE